MGEFVRRETIMHSFNRLTHSPLGGGMEIIDLNVTCVIFRSMMEIEEYLRNKIPSTREKTDGHSEENVI